MRRMYSPEIERGVARREKSSHLQFLTKTIDPETTKSICNREILKIRSDCNVKQIMTELLVIVSCLEDTGKVGKELVPFVDDTVAKRP